MDGKVESAQGGLSSSHIQGEEECSSEHLHTNDLKQSGSSMYFIGRFCNTVKEMLVLTSLNPYSENNICIYMYVRDLRGRLRHLCGVANS